MKSRTLKWIVIVVLIVIGIVAAIVAVEYLTTSIGKLPSWMPGHKTPTAGHHIHGHYKKRGYGALLVAVVAFVVAGYLFVVIRREDKGGSTPAAPAGTAAPAAPAASASDLMSAPAPAPAPTTDSAPSAPPAEEPPTT